MSEHWEPASPQPRRVAVLPTWLLSQANVRAHRLLTEALSAQGTRGYHYRLLAALAEIGSASQTLLGERTAIDRSDVVAALNELEAAALVNRTPDARDRRRNVVSLTRQGEARLAELDLVIAAVQEEVLSPLTGPQRRHLVEALAKLAGG